jgi:TusA-related sulfurtransferase
VFVYIYCGNMDEAGSSIRGSTKVPPSAGKSGSGKEDGAPKRTKRWKALAYKTILGRRIEIDIFPGGSDLYLPATVDSESLRPSWHVGVMFDQEPGSDAVRLDCVYEEIDLIHNKEISYRWLLDPPYGDSGKGPKPNLEAGSTIEVLYDNPEEFFAARVESFNKLTGKATLIYDDEVVDQVNLKNSGLKYKILKSDEVLERYFNDEWKELALEATLGRRIEVANDDGDYFAATVDSKSLRPKSWSVRVTYDKHRSRASSPPSSEVLDLLHDKNIDYRWLLDPLYGGSGKDTKSKLKVGSTIEVLYDDPEKFYAARVFRCQADAR